MKINFERNENGCFTDTNVANHSINTNILMAVMLNEIQTGRHGNLHDIFEDQALYISVPVENEEGVTVFETNRVLLVNEGGCPFNDGKVFDDKGRLWNIEDTDVAFTTEREADMFTFFSNIKLDLADKTAELVNETIGLIIGIELFGLPDDPELLIRLLEKVDEIKTQLDNISDTLQAINEILDGIGDE